MTEARSTAEAAQRASLRRMQRGATLLLGASLATLVAAKAFEPRYPGLAWVAAFAEAATIGGLADWYAVVALFRRPMGLPIPHTAILPANQARIADSLGEFIESNFLEADTVARKLGETDFAALMVDWLSDEARAGMLAGFAIRMLPGMLDAAEHSRTKGFLAEQLVEAARRVNIGPVLANLLEGLADQGKHQQALDYTLNILGRLLLEPKSVELVLTKIREELPSVLRALGADGFLLRKILMAAAGFIEEIKHTPDHPMRGEVDRLIRKLVWRLRTSRDMQGEVNRFKDGLIARPETAELLQVAWASLRRTIETDIASPDPALRRHLTGILVASARRLGEDGALKAEINAGMVVALSAFIERQKHAVSHFISAQVKAWDMERMTDLVEQKIGRDLQYIRFNGTLIGGLIGLALYAVMHAFGLR
jgi:uncharacterized membrane-anchored protein YjiN (DUF445 family)